MREGVLCLLCNRRRGKCLLKGGVLVISIGPENKLSLKCLGSLMVAMPAAERYA